MPIIDAVLGDFFWRALIGGLGVALIAGPLGCFVVWRRMAYFGDTLAHSALLGIALSFLISVPLNVGVIVTCVVLAIALVLFSRSKTLATDTLLGILAHSALAIGLVTLSFMPNIRVDLTGLLFGDLLVGSAAATGTGASGANKEAFLVFLLRIAVPGANSAVVLAPPPAAEVAATGMAKAVEEAATLEATSSRTGGRRAP